MPHINHKSIKNFVYIFVWLINFQMSSYLLNNLFIRFLIDDRRLSPSSTWM
ncbi:hypothetical protein EMIT0194MI4_40113 [Pseudomonas sp. IT-194MI4]